MKPPATIAILGGGQLGRMSAIAAKTMGYRVITLTPERGSPCGQVCDEEWVAPFDDDDALLALAKEAAVVTYEFENVPARSVKILEDQGVAHPSSHILHLCQHRIREKEALRALGIPVAPFAPVENADQLAAAAQRLGYPCVLKTTTGGYDGKGQRVIRSPRDLTQAWKELGQGTHSTNPESSPRLRMQGEPRWVLETFVPFERELSVIVGRTVQGECVSFPVVENIHVNNILHRSTAPAPIPDEQARRAQRLAEQIATGLNLVGIMGVELFAGRDFLYVNELAPRPHNSGHFTLDACTTSQFEQHVRAVCGLPLGPTDPTVAAVMLNILGQHVPRLLNCWSDVLRLPWVKVHLYGKGKALPQRKMGHLTVLADDVGEAMARAEHIWSRYLAAED